MYDAVQVDSNLIQVRQQVRLVEASDDDVMLWPIHWLIVCSQNNLALVQSRSYSMPCLI